jgi:hypothetical protein
MDLTPYQREAYLTPNLLEQVTGLAGVAPAVVAAAAQRVDPAGYISLAGALRAVRNALAAAALAPVTPPAGGSS